MGRITDFSLTLMVHHPTADLSFLPGRIGLAAVRIWKAGEPRTTPKGQLLDGVWRDSYCGLAVVHALKSTLPSAIAGLIDRLEPNRNVLAALRAGGGTIMLVVYWATSGNTGETFEPPLLAALAEFGIALGIDVYDLPQHHQALNSRQ